MESSVSESVGHAERITLSTKGIISLICTISSLKNARKFATMVEQTKSNRGNGKGNRGGGNKVQMALTILKQAARKAEKAVA